MYNHFFGFKERPFKLVPNPDYLFLSKSHEEALAHLRYAVTDGEGFVEIIGEIGTGKTMLCRTFLESLDEDTESAYIFNPRMDALDLLRAINDEFGISKDHHSIKALIDELNAFLIEKKAAGKKVILLIDEAQNLSKDVLEQIRLLSNLETTKDKLLQIILVGQPELGEMLDTHELRQLGQRISLSCRLHPLTYAETKQYIAHRILVASQTSGPVFSKSAIRRIYKFSKGIPRLINMACDRSLLNAFGRHRLKVSGSIAKSAIQELTARDNRQHGLLPDGSRRLFWLTALCAVLVIGLCFHFDIWHLIPRFSPVDTPVSVIEKETIRPGATARIQDRQSLPLPKKNPPGDGSGKSETIYTDAEPAGEINAHAYRVDFRQVLIDGSGIFSRNAAFESLLKTWQMDETSLQDIDAIDDDATFFDLAAQQNGLVATPVNDDLGQIVSLNIPAILKFDHPSGGAPLYLTVIKATPDGMTFSGNGALPEVSVPYARILENWTGIGFVFWKNFYNYQGIIPLNAPGESVITLKLHLRDIGYKHIEISGKYDLATRMAIKAIQARHDIPIDGYVGPLTKIVLYNEKRSLPIPHLWEQMSIPKEAAGMAVRQKKTEADFAGFGTDR